MPFGSWPLLVKRGPLEVSPRFPDYRRVRNTAPSLGERFSISLVEVPMLSASPNMPKSPRSLRTARKHPAGPTIPENGSLYLCQSGLLRRCFSERVFWTVSMQVWRPKRWCRARATKRPFSRTPPLYAEGWPQSLGRQHPPRILRDCGFDEMFAGSSHIMWAHSSIM
jgi:hypothetical protein